MRLEEKTKEASTLSRQLEQSLSDIRRVEEESREKAISRERNSQARMLDLESQLSRVKAEILQVRRQKEDVSLAPHPIPAPNPSMPPTHPILLET